MTIKKKTKKWVKDIKPVSPIERSTLGVAALHLSPEQSLKAIGLVYGVEHQVSGDGFDATLFLDVYNQRIKVLDYNVSNFEAFIMRVRWIAEANGFEKIICMAGQDDWQKFLQFGYVLEAVLRYYHKGEDAFVVSKFRSQARLTSASLMEETLLIEEIMGQEVEKKIKPLPAGFEIRMARPEDITQMLDIYKEIFESYPSPLIHRSYLETIFQKNSLFVVCTEGERIVATASAELDLAHLAAELTDCATINEKRGLGLMSHVLSFLEKSLIERKYVCAYTMARARSYGMNMVFYQLGYEFLGRLVNNCDIFGAFEDMNIWVRNLKPALSEDSPKKKKAEENTA